MPGTVHAHIQLWLEHSVPALSHRLRKASERVTDIWTGAGALPNQATPGEVEASDEAHTGVQGQGWVLHHSNRLCWRGTACATVISNDHWQALFNAAQARLQANSVHSGMGSLQLYCLNQDIWVVSGACE